MRIKRIVNDGLDAYHIKMIALIFMTIDHLGAYAFEIPVISAHYSALRILGRIAAPLFLYILTDSIRYTHSKTGYLIRLYVAASGSGLITTVMNYSLGDMLGVHSQSNILFSLFYVALYTVLIEALLAAVHRRELIKSLAAVAAISATYILHLIRQYFYGLSGVGLLGRDLFDSFIQSPLLTEYSPLFIIMGVLMYFTRKKWLKVAVFLFFCCVSFDPLLSAILRQRYFSDFVGYPQYWMVLATPFMFFYNGKRGTHHNKLFFYLYYPIHRYVIIIISALAVSFSQSL